jgi:hypothetical protein
MPKRHRRQARKQFFFGKKNQNTLARFGLRPFFSFEPEALVKRQKFFVSFFEKRNTFFLH